MSGHYKNIMRIEKLDTIKAPKDCYLGERVYKLELMIFVRVSYVCNLKMRFSLYIFLLLASDRLQSRSDLLPIVTMELLSIQ